MEKDAESLSSEKEKERMIFMEDMTNEAILKEAQAKIIAREDDPDYTLEQHTKDIDLIADLTCLIHKYREDRR